jgi:hypothetical protein
MSYIRLLVISLAVFLAPLVVSAQEEAFHIPLDRIDRYQPLLYEEIVETTPMSRIRLQGKIDLVYDPIADMLWQQDSRVASVAFYNRFEPRLRYEVTSFQAGLPESEFGVDLIMRYLDGQAQKYAENSFEILLQPEVTSGPARFRIFGQRALSFTFSYLEEGSPVIRGENWVERDGLIHIVAVEAHNERAFKTFFERVRQAMNSMVEIE